MMPTFRMLLHALFTVTVKSTVIFEVVNKQVILGRGRGDEVYGGKRAGVEKVR